MMDWTNICLASAFWPAPRAFAINAVAPWLNPLPTAMRTKNTGNESESPASASVLSNPAQYVSTKLYMVLKNSPTLDGTAIRQMSCGMGSVVSESGRLMVQHYWDGVFK